MSKVVHPYAHRLPLIRGWQSRWFRSGKSYRDTLRADTMIREYLEKKLRGSYVADIWSFLDKEDQELITQSMSLLNSLRVNLNNKDSYLRAKERFLKEKGDKE